MISGESAQITIRPVRESDAPFLARVGPRLFPGSTASPRDPDQFRTFFNELTPETLASTSDGIASIAELDGEPVGVVAAHLDVDYFTKHARLYIDTIAVADEAEGGGGRARGFYETCGYAADHFRMVKPLG